MNPWQAEPYWQTLNRLRPTVQIVASDLLTVVVTEYAIRPRRLGSFRGLDRLRSQIRQGVPGVIIRR